MKPFEDLNPEQQKRFGEVVDSRVRLLGEPYGRAVERVQADGGGNEDWIMGGGA